MKARLPAHLAILLLLGVCAALPVKAGCEPYPISEHSPTGIVGCVVYGEGTASMWGGPGIARNDCVYPWDACQPIAITSLETGLTIVVTPSMFCDCYTSTSEERIVDLDPAAVAALGLDPSRGLWAVRVHPVGSGSNGEPVPPVREGTSSNVLPPPLSLIPDTAVRP